MRQHFFFCIILLGLFVFTPVIAQQDEHVPTNLVPITPANADRLVRVGTLGRGYTFNIGYADNDTIMTVSAGGLWSYDADQISDPPDWQYNRLGFFTLRNHYGYRTLPPNVENWDDYIFEAWYEEGIESVIFTQSGHYVATHDRQFPDQCQRDASCMKKVILWDTITQTPKFEIIEPEIGGVTFALQDTYLGIIRAEETDFYDVTSGELVFTIPVSLDHFSTHGSTTAEVDSNDGDLKFVVWDIQSRQPVMELSFLPEEMISNVAFSDDGTRVAISSHMGDLNATIAIWDIRSRRRVATFEHGGQVTRMVFSPDNRYLAAYGWRWGADDDRLTIKLYDLATFQLRTTLPNNLWRSAVAVAFRPDGSQLAIVYVDGRMQTINTRTGDIIEEVRGYPGYPVDAAFTTNAIITTNAEDEIYLWHPDTFSPVGAHSDCTLLAYQEETDTALCQSPYGVNSAKLQHMTTDEYIASIDIGAYREYDTIMAAAFSPDGQQIATTSHGVQLWNAANGELEQMLLDQSSNISFGIKYTQDGRFLAAGDSGTIWDVESGDVLVQPSIEPAWHSALTFSEAGDWYALPSKDGNVYVWRLSDLLNGEAANPDTALATLRVMTPYRSDGWIYAQFVYTAASPDGRLLAAIYAGDLFLFDMETFTLVHQIPERGHLLRFSPDGRLLLVGNGYCYCGAADESAQVGHARLWGVPSTEE